jgi:hypothetical protein
MTRYYDTRSDAEKNRRPADRILFKNGHGYYIKRVETAFWG